MKTATRSLITRICESELSVQFNSVVQSCPTLCDPINSNMPGFPVYHQLPELTQTHSTESVMPFNHPILLSPSPLAFNLSQHQGFSSDLAFHIRWLKYWSFSFSNFPSIEYSGLISSRVDRFDLAVHGTLKSLLQHHTLKAWH